LSLISPEAYLKKNIATFICNVGSHK